MSASMNFFDALCEITLETTLPAQVVQKEAYSITTASALKFAEYGDGLYVAQFSSIYSGILRLIPGGFKKRAMTRDSPLKFFVLQGEIEVTCSGDVFRLKTFGFLEVVAGSFYSLKNVSEEDVFIQFTRDLGRLPAEEKKMETMESEQSKQESSSSKEEDISTSIDESFSPVKKAKGIRKSFAFESTSSDESSRYSEMEYSAPAKKAEKKIRKPKYVR